MSFAKQRKHSGKAIRRCKREQLGYLRRNLKAIDDLLAEGGEVSEKPVEVSSEKTIEISTETLTEAPVENPTAILTEEPTENPVGNSIEELTDKLSEMQKIDLEILKAVYNQQREMCESRTNSIENRIVSLSQPHIRPIMREKAGKPVEFGAKVDMSVVNGYVFINEICYYAFSEGKLLENAVVDYYVRFGVFPKEILADQAYRTRENRAICKELGIRLMGKPLGRPRKARGATQNTTDDSRSYPQGNAHDDPYNLTADNSRRNIVEGRFGTLKTRYGWNRIMARMPPYPPFGVHIIQNLALFGRP